jgi:hypothetical protein
MGGTKMSQWQMWFHEKQVERTIKALKKNNFEALFVPDSKAAFEEVMKRIPDGTTVSVGGSITLGQVGLLDALEKRKINFIFPMKQGKTPEEVHALIQKTFLSDIYLSGTNAITEDGKLFNVDATGNRVGAMFIGPKKVIVIAGLNKIVPDMEAAEERIRWWVGPQNAKRLNRKTPCVETGVCSDCSSPERICNINVTLRKKPSRTDVTVILVGENLGI